MGSYLDLRPVRAPVDEEAAWKQSGYVQARAALPLGLCEQSTGFVPAHISTPTMLRRQPCLRMSLLLQKGSCPPLSMVGAYNAQLIMCMTDSRELYPGCTERGPKERTSRDGPLDGGAGVPAGAAVQQRCTGQELQVGACSTGGR